jgi:hypothetical protein
MYAATFRIHPKELADLLANAVDIGKDKTTHPLICLAASSDSLHAYGRGRYTAGRDWRRFEADTPQFADLVITEEEAEELAGLLRKVEGAGRKETRIGVTMTERDRIIVQNGDEILADLPDADVNQISYGMPDELSDWEEIDNLLMDIQKSRDVTGSWGSPAPLTRFAFQKDILARMNKIRADSNVMDIAIHPDGRIVGIALGSSFRALIAGVDRHSFATGGKWGEGPGTPEQLWEA